MRARGVLVAGVLLAVVAGGVLVALALRDEGEEPRAQAPARSDGAETSPPPPQIESAGPIRFVLADRYVVGETVDVAIENVGARRFIYQTYYQACFLRYFDSTGRRFIIPPGTHCDLLDDQTIKPGERRKLFTWRLDECVKDNWGCVKSEPLPPGTYTIRGRFELRSAGTPVRAEATFTIVAAS